MFQFINHFMGMLTGSSNTMFNLAVMKKLQDQQNEQKQNEWENEQDDRCDDGDDEPSDMLNDDGTP